MESRRRWEGDRAPAGLLRLSVGLQDPHALWADLAQALEHASTGKLPPGKYGSDYGPHGWTAQFPWPRHARSFPVQQHCKTDHAR